MRKRYLVLLLLFVTAFFQKKVFALGIGAYSKSSVGYSTLSQLDYTTGFGIVLDTAVAKPSRFNYRLNIGYETYGKSGSQFFTEKAWHRVTLNNTFGYALFVNEYIRVWLGPRWSLACQFDQVQDHSAKYLMLIPSPYVSAMSRDIRTYVLGISSLGVVAGFNLNIGDTVTVSIESGLSAGMSIGMMRQESYYSPLPVIQMGNPNLYLIYHKSGQDELTNGFFEFQVQLSILFRIGDRSIGTTAAKVESMQR